MPAPYPHTPNNAPSPTLSDRIREARFTLDTLYRRLPVELLGTTADPIGIVLPRQVPR